LNYGPVGWIRDKRLCIDVLCLKIEKRKEKKGKRFIRLSEEFRTSTKKRPEIIETVDEHAYVPIF